MAATLLIDGLNMFTEFGLVVQKPDPWAGMVATQRQTTALPGHLGVLPAEWGASESRVLSLGLYKKAATIAALVALRDDLAEFLSGRLLHVQYPDAPDRFVRAVCTGLMPGLAASAFTQTDADLAVQLTCFDAAKYDVEPRSVALSTTPAPLDLGTAASVGEVWIPGPVSTEIVITLRAPSGLELGSVTITPDLATDEFMKVRLLRPATITKVDDAGVMTPQYAWKTGGRWLALASAPADRTSGARVTLGLSQGTGVLYYHRAWLL